MSVNLNKTYWAIVDESTGDTYCGGNSKTNGLYSSRGRAQTQYNRYIRRWESYMKNSYMKEETRDQYQKYIDDFKESYRIKEVRIAS